MVPSAFVTNTEVSERSAILQQVCEIVQARQLIATADHLLPKSAGDSRLCVHPCRQGQDTTGEPLSRTIQGLQRHECWYKFFFSDRSDWESLEHIKQAHTNLDNPPQITYRLSCGRSRKDNYIPTKGEGCGS